MDEGGGEMGEFVEDESKNRRWTSISSHGYSNQAHVMQRTIKREAKGPRPSACGAARGALRRHPELVDVEETGEDDEDGVLGVDNEGGGKCHTVERSELSQSTDSGNSCQSPGAPCTNLPGDSGTRTHKMSSSEVFFHPCFYLPSSPSPLSLPSLHLPGSATVVHAYPTRRQMCSP